MAVVKRIHCKSCGADTFAENPPKSGTVPCRKCGLEATVSDKWYVRMRLPVSDGKSKLYSKAVSKKIKEAKAHEADLTARKFKEEYFDAKKKIPFSDAAHQFLEDCRQRVAEKNLGARSYETYKGIIETVLNPYFGNTDVSEITPKACERFKQDRMKDTRRYYSPTDGVIESDKTVSFATVNRGLATLSCIMSYLKKEEVIDSNPVSLVARLKEDNKRDKFLTPEEVDLLLDTCKERSSHLFMATLLALDAGLRKSACFNLRWKNIDLKNNQLSALTKGNKIVFVPLTERLRKELIAHRMKQAAKSINGYVIPSPKNPEKPMRVDANFGFETVCRDLGFEDFVFHDLRHTFVSIFIARNNGDIYTCSKIVGHSTTYMTERYGHLLNEAAQRAMQRFGGGESQN